MGGLGGRKTYLKLDSQTRNFLAGAAVTHPPAWGLGDRACGEVGGWVGGLLWVDRGEEGGLNELL